MATELQAEIDAEIYCIMQEDHPALVLSIRRLVEIGETPDQIERRLRARFGNTQVARNAGHVAQHIRRMNNSLEAA